MNAAAPLIEPLPDETILERVAYVGPPPILTDGTPPIVWTLLDGPEGMSIDPDTGAVSWPQPRFEAQPVTVTIAAGNAEGEAETSWQLTVGVRAWEPLVLAFSSAASLNWASFPLQVTFTHAAHQITVDGYWDGGNTWKARFAPPVAGTWQWTSQSSDGSLDARSGTITVFEPSGADVALNPNYRGHVRQSANNRYFEYADGTPFFWIGDTNWSLTTLRSGIGPDNDNFFTYLDDRLAKAFTVIQTQYCSPRYENEGGTAIPSYPGNWNGLNPGYFQGVDTRLQTVWERGLLIAAHPTWFSELTVSLDDAQNLSRYLWARYGAYNTVWSVSGEYSTAYVHGANDFRRADWDALGSFVSQLGGQPHPISIHPRNFVAANPGVSFSSSHEFHDTTWLDHNWVQSFFYLEETRRQVAADYARTPIKPVIHSEGAYEAGYPAGYNLSMDYEFIDDYLVRLQAWTAYLYGAAGHTYGAHGVWPMYDPSFADPGHHDAYTRPWYEDLVLEGSADMQHIRAFFAGLDWYRMEPMSGYLMVNGRAVSAGSDSDYSDPSAMGRWGEVYAVYIPRGHAGSLLELTHLGCMTYTGRWYNPRSGQYTAIDTPITPAAGTDTWALPARPDTNDWVLLLEQSFGATGDTAPPVIQPIDDMTINAGTRFTGPQPVLNAEATCVTWTLVEGPAGMEIDTATGVVSWANPTLLGSPHTVTVQATNAAGVDTQSWRMTVEELAVVIDNEDAGFSVTGNLGSSSFTPGYYANGYRYASAGSGNRQAMWRFAVVDGQYALSAQWAAYSNRASNATYQVRNNGATLGSQVFDQRTGGGVFNPFDLIYTVAAGTLEVVLTDAADGYVIADAVQAEFVGAGGNRPPNGAIEAPGGDVTITAGDNVVFSATGTDPEDHLPLSFHWDFGDPAVADADVASPGAVSFPTVGTHLVELTVTDSEGAIDPSPATVVVEVVPVVSGGGLEVIDDADAAFSRTGAWGSSAFTAGYYGSGYRHAPAGSGARQAVWTFGVEAGQYRLAAQWSAFANRASNATYRVRNNGILIGSQRFDQRTGGGGFNAFDTVFTVNAGTLEVVLTDEADGYVIADAVQAEYIGAGGGNAAPNGEITSPSGSVSVVAGTAVSFSGSGTDPDGDLPLSYSWDFGDPAIPTAAGATPAAVVYATAGSYTARLTVRDSLGLADATPAEIAVMVTAVAGGVINTVDDGDAGMRTVGSWGSSAFVPGFYGSGYRYVAAGSGALQAVWTFSVVDGQYALAAQWAAHPNRASNATYQVRNNGVVIGSQTFDQRSDGGRFNPFTDLFTVSAGTLEVVLSDAADGYVIADAVQAERMEPAPQ